LAGKIDNFGAVASTTSTMRKRAQTGNAFNVTFV
jgi:hypothetical protein